MICDNRKALCGIGAHTRRAGMEVDHERIPVRMQCAVLPITQLC